MNLRQCLNAALIGVLTLALAAFTHAEETTFAQPGDTGSIEFPIGNLLESDGPLEGARMDVDKPAFFTVTGVSVLGPDTIPPAVVKTFVVEYEIGTGAPEGPFTVTLRPRADTENVEPVMSTLDTSVKLNDSRGPFYVGGAKAEICRIGFMNGVNCGVDPGRAAALDGLSKGVGGTGTSFVRRVGTALFSALGAHVAAGGPRAAAGEVLA